MTMTVPEDPPGFVVRTETQQAAASNGFRLPRGTEKGWLRYASTTAPGTVWIAGASSHGPWLLSIDHAGIAAELDPLPKMSEPGPGIATFVLETPTDLHAALDRVYKLAVSLPEAPLARFRARTASLPKATEAERLVVQRIGQDIFRDALMTYWGGCCPLTGIADPALLRASHIVPWAECGDEQRLDVHNRFRQGPRQLHRRWPAAGRPEPQPRRPGCLGCRCRSPHPRPPRRPSGQPRRSPRAVRFLTVTSPLSMHTVHAHIEQEHLRLERRPRLQAQRDAALTEIEHGLEHWPASRVRLQ
jgi:hypothetical protein